MDQNIKLVLKYLKEHDFIEAYLTLQRQSQVKYVSYSKEIEFFKKIMLRGNFAEAISFVCTFQNRLDEKDMKKIALDIYKQKLYELIDNPNQDELKSLFERELVNYCTEEEFQQLFGYLTFRGVNEIEGMEKWSVIKGRYECFQSVISYLELFNSVVRNEEISDKLEDMIEFYYSRGRSTDSPAKRSVQIDYGKETLQKNSSVVPRDVIKSSLEEEAEKLNNRKQPQSIDKQKQTIKNSIISMNLSGNYSNIRSQLNPNQSKRYNNYPSFQENDTKEQKSLVIDKSGIIRENNATTVEKNASVVHQSMPVAEKSLVFPQKRSRVNASLNGPMNRQKLQASNVKLDNFFKNDSNSNMQPDNPIKPLNNSIKPVQKYEKPDKSQVLAHSILNPSQLSKSREYSNPLKPAYQYLETPVILTQLNELQSSQLNQISEQQHSEAAKSVNMQKQKYSYLSKSKHEDEQLEEQVKKNIQYLEQTSSVVYKTKEEVEQESYTFSNCIKEKEQKVNNIIKLAVITDSKAIRTCQFSSSGNYFAVGTNSSILKLFDVQRLFSKSTLQQIQPIYQIDNLHLKSIFCLAWTNNERGIATCSNDLHIKLTQVSKGFSQHKTTIIGKHESCIRMVRFNQLETRLVSCGDDSTIKVWDLGKVKKCTNLKNHTNSVSAIKLHNQNELYSVSKDFTIRKWDLRTCQNVATSKVQDSQLTYIANNTDRIIVSHKDGSVSFFNNSLVLQHAVKIHDEEIRSVQALRGEDMLLTASFDGHVALFTESSSDSPNYFQHNDAGDDKVVFATFLHSPHYRGFSSTSTQGLCHIYSYQ